MPVVGHLRVSLSLCVIEDICVVGEVELNMKKLIEHPRRLLRDRFTVTVGGSIGS